jgi:hypothetical protein
MMRFGCIIRALSQNSWERCVCPSSKSQQKPFSHHFSPFLAIYPAGSIADSPDDSRVEPFSGFGDAINKW